MNDTTSSRSHDARKSVFVSTAIPYVNAAPHVGFALEVILADVIARHARARGADVWLTAGTDDHSTKNVHAANAAGVPVRAFVDAAAERYLALGEVVGASYDTFVRTSASPAHAAAVRELWERCARRGDLYRQPYRGHYCTGCEQFYDPIEIEAAGGACPEHGTPLQIIEEENWFFRLSRYAAQVEAAITGGALRIHPPERANEVLSFLASGVHDVSVSRSRARTYGWGLPVPGDPEQIIYVWFDALVSYLTAIGFPAEEPRIRRHWHEASRRIHVLGKGIARFHAVLWPAVLLAAELPLPTDLLVHGYLTVDGRKIGKSLGNAIDPREFVERFGKDGLRWYLLRHVGPGNDGDISVARIASVYAAELANGLGNLVARTLTLVRRSPSSAAVPTELGPSGEALARTAGDLAVTVDAVVERFAVDDALRAIAALVSEANGHLSRTEPWAIAKRRDAAPAADVPRLDADLRAALHPAVLALDAIARALAPFLPDTASRLGEALADPAAPVPILFPRIVEPA